MPRRKYLITDPNLTLPYALIFTYGLNAIHLALFLYISTDIQLENRDTTAKSSCTKKQPSQNIQTSVKSVIAVIDIGSLLIILVVSLLLLILANDIEVNPGPPTQYAAKEMTVIHLNAGSIRNKIDIVSTETSKYDIVTVSETWLKDNIENNDILLPGFSPPFRLDRNGYGGVAIYAKSDIISKPRVDLHVDGLEAIWIEVRENNKILLICSMYRPPESLVPYWRLIEESVKKASNTPHKFIILGDFNSDCVNDIYYEHYQLRDIITRYNLTQLINEPTRRTGHSARCIDLILTSTTDIISESRVLLPICSDHHLPLVKLKIERKIPTNIKRTIYNYSRLNIIKFKEKLSEIDFMNAFTINTVNNSATFLSETLMKIAKLCMPVKTITIREDSPPWFDEGIMNLRDEKYFIHYIAKQFDTAELWELFRRVRNAYTDAIRKRKKEYLNELDERVSNKNNFGTKDWWKLVNNFIKDKGNNNRDIPPLEGNNTIFYTNKEKADCLNTYFSNQSKVEGDNDPLPPVQLLNSQIEHIQLLTEDVQAVIQHLDTSKAVGPDLIHNKLLVAAGPIIIEPLTFLFNKSLTEGVFPDCWKIAHITPIYKLKGERSDCSNYRPISLLSCVGKILEKCIQKYILQYLNAENIITPSQSGFRQGDSTIYQLLTIYDDFSIALDNRTPTQAIFFDISKAFDRVWHRGLLHKLHGVGIRGQLLTWIHSYLEDRKQAVVIKGEISNFLPVTAGVPQGSVLGPLFFLLYINDLNKNIESNIKLFADDTSAYQSLGDDIQREFILNSDLQKISTWAHLWKVKFSAPKTDLLNITRRLEPLTNQLIFNGTILQPSEIHKHLGIIFQSDCTWNSHINFLIAKCRPLVACLKSFKYRLSRQSLETMYKSFILPILDYADVVWDNCTQYQSDALEDLQLEVIRTITGAVRGTSHNKLYKESGFITLKERRKRHKLILYFKYINNLLPEHISIKFPRLVSETNPYHRRRPLERNNFFCHTELYKRSFFPCTTELWNELPDDIKSLTSISAFKRFFSNNDYVVPPYFYIGDRLEQIIHCKLRLKMSDLKFDLYNRHLSDSFNCQCNAEREDAKHYLLHCPLYNRERALTINVLPYLSQNSETLLNGNNSFSETFNSYIFLTLQDFIKLTKRFDSN